jgi:hypothetical protein
MGTYIIIGFIILVIIGLVQQAKKTTNSKQGKEKELADIHNLNDTNKLFSAEYLGGHPSINNPSYLRGFDKDNHLVLVKFFTEKVTDDKVGLYDAYNFEICGTIPFNSIKDVSFENASTIQSRVTAGRMLLVGPLAFAWKKKEKHECAYIIIQWSDGRFNHETLFEFTGGGSIQSANTGRNKLINSIKKAEAKESI